MSLRQFGKLFADEEASARHLVKPGWGDGFVRPACGGTKGRELKGDRCRRECADAPPLQVNFRNALWEVGRQVVTMFLMQRNFLVAGLAHIVAGISRSMRRERPGRSRPRKSMKPRSKRTNRTRARTGAPETSPWLRPSTRNRGLSYPNSLIP